MIVTKPKKLLKVHPKASRKIVSWEHTCQKCGHVWVTENESPATCPHKDCRSPNWNKDYSELNK